MKLMKLFFSVTAICLLLGTSGAAMAGLEQLQYTGCLKDKGDLKKVAPGINPVKPCKKKEIVLSIPDQEEIDILT